MLLPSVLRSAVVSPLLVVFSLVPRTRFLRAADSFFDLRFLLEAQEGTGRPLPDESIGDGRPCGESCAGAVFLTAVLLPLRSIARTALLATSRRILSLAFLLVSTYFSIFITFSSAKGNECW